MASPLTQAMTFAIYAYTAPHCDVLKFEQAVNVDYSRPTSISQCVSVRSKKYANMSPRMERTRPAHRRQCSQLEVTAAARLICLSQNSLGNTLQTLTDFTSSPQKRNERKSDRRGHHKCRKCGKILWRCRPMDSPRAN